MLQLVLFGAMKRLFHSPAGKRSTVARDRTLEVPLQLDELHFELLEHGRQSFAHPQRFQVLFEDLRIARPRQPGGIRTCVHMCEIDMLSVTLRSLLNPRMAAAWRTERSRGFGGRHSPFVGS
jgi:hypothetical protein